MLGVAVDDADDVVGEARVRTPQSAGDPAGTAAGAAAEVADAVAEVVAVLGRQAGAAPTRPRRSGSGVPGHARPPRGAALLAQPARARPGPTCGALVAARLPLSELLVENDANCAAVAEHRIGAARGADDAVVVTLGTGIGGGLISAGRVVVGAHGFAGEIGHMVVDPSGPPCPCGRRGCWERFASGGGTGPPGPGGRRGRAAAAAWWPWPGATPSWCGAST